MADKKRDILILVFKFFIIQKNTYKKPNKICVVVIKKTASRYKR